MSKKSTLITSYFVKAPTVVAKRALETDAAPTTAPKKPKTDPSTEELLQLELDTIHFSWLKYLDSEIRKPYFIDLKKFLWQEGVRGSDTSLKGKVFPEAKNIYSWSSYTPLDQVKVVILGQDPYHDNGQAHGLAFSVLPGVKIPPSLRNIYKEVKTEYPDFNIPTHGYLVSYAKSGVLMLNSALTVKPHQAMSHANKGWEPFTDAVIDIIDKHSPGAVFLAWGASAAKRVKRVDTKKHLILNSAHPSPLSAHRGFFGNGHFKAANEWLEKKYGTAAKIDWLTVEK